MDVEIDTATVLAIIQSEFPREYTIAVQRAHILRLEEMLQAAQAPPSPPLKEATP